MKPVSLTSDVFTRCILWALVFQVEILYTAAARTWVGSIGHDALHITETALMLFLTYLLGNNSLARDFRDLCFFDFLVQCFGWYSYKYGHSMGLYEALEASVLMLKFVRLLWPLPILKGNASSHWPVFGPFGWDAQRIGVKEKISWRESSFVYIWLISTPVIIFLHRMYGGKNPLALWASLGVIIILLGFRPFQAYLQKQEIERQRLIEEAAAKRVTEEKNAELARVNQQLAASNQRLEEVNQRLQAQNTEIDRKNTELASMARAITHAAHDMAQPICLLNIAVLRFMHARDETERALAFQNLHHQNSIVAAECEDILYGAKLACEIGHAQREPFPPFPIIRELWVEWRFAAERMEHPGFLFWPICDPGLVALGDARLVKRMVRNLFLNALTHSPPGSAILISMRKRQGQIMIEVWNQGAGIPDGEEGDPVANFEHFAARMLQTSQERRDGHGLGIDNLLHLARSAGIQMTLRSRNGKGCVFGFALPLSGKGQRP